MSRQTEIRFYDRAGELHRGYFFQIEIPYDTDLSVRMTPDSGLWIVSDSGTNIYESEAYVELSFRSEERRDCPLDPSHITASGERVVTSADLKGNDGLAEFVRVCFEPRTIVTEDFGRRLHASQLRGIALTSLTVNFNQSRLREIPQLYELVFQGSNSVRPMRVHLPVPNECPRCHWGPVICPACNDTTYVCPECQLELIGWTNKPHERPFNAEIINDTDYIVEAHEWDGSDFFAEKYITRRALQYLMSVHATPFVAKPCWANVERLTESQMSTLRAL